MKPLAAQTISGTVIAEYPDFAPGTPVRVLPAIVSNNFPTDRRIIDDAWSFAGPTRHPEYAVIRHDRDHITVTMQRHRLQQRPPVLDVRPCFRLPVSHPPERICP